MSFKSDIDAEAKQLIAQGVSSMEALKQAVRIVTKKLSAEMEEIESEFNVMPGIKKE